MTIGSRGEKGSSGPPGIQGPSGSLGQKGQKGARGYGGNITSWNNFIYWIIYVIERKVWTTYKSFIGSCCPVLNVTATGPAKDKQSDCMGAYEFYTLSENGIEMFKKGDKYLYLDNSNGYWIVRKITLNISLIMISFITHYFSKNT